MQRLLICSGGNSKCAIVPPNQKYLEKLNYKFKLNTVIDYAKERLSIIILRVVKLLTNWVLNIHSLLANSLSIKRIKLRWNSENLLIEIHWNLDHLGFLKI